MLVAAWVDYAFFLGPAALGVAAGYAVSVKLSGRGRGVFAFAIPPLVTLCYSLFRALDGFTGEAGLGWWVMALFLIVGLELGVFSYSLLHRDPRTPTHPQQYLS